MLIELGTTTGNPALVSLPVCLRMLKREGRFANSVVAGYIMRMCNRCLG